MERTNWRQLCDRGPDLVLCLDFPGGRAVAGFAELAAGVPVEACFLHVEGVSGPLAASVDRWAAELTAAGRPVRAVLGFCAGAAIATRLADAIAAAGGPGQSDTAAGGPGQSDTAAAGPGQSDTAAAGPGQSDTAAGGPGQSDTAAAPPPTVVLIDADSVTGDSLTTGFTEALESSAGHLTAGELADARDLAEQLKEKYPDDLPRIAAALTDRYDQLMGAVADRLRLHEFLRKELTAGFTAYLDYLLLAAEGGFDTRSTTPLFLWSPGHEPLVEGARNITFDSGHADLLRDPQVHKLVTDLLTGEHAW